jgi:hypothetical protein
MSDLALSCLVSTPLGPLQLEGGPYSLHAETISEVAVTWRKKTVTNPHVEGSFTVHAERENVVVPVSVWVEAATRSALRVAQQAVEDAFSQLHYTITFDVEGDTQTWQCEAADYTVDTQQAFLMAKTALVRAKVPRLPAVVFS